ncbi:MAG: GNAT family N-acetyltransferase [Candidatus Limnocylindrales bacterium]
MTYETRTAREAEILPWLEALTTGFLDRPNIHKIAEQLGPYWDFTRLWATFDGDAVVGTLRSWPTELTVPGGGLVPATAIAAVTVQATHRRRGILRQMIEAEHRAARKRGEAVAILYVSEASIYGRFGYGVAVQPCEWALDASGTGFIGAPATDIEFLPEAESTADVMRTLFDQARKQWPGEIRRRDFSFRMDIGLLELEWEGPWKGWVVGHRGADGELDGYARYTAKTEWEHHQPRGKIDVRDLVALNDVAYDALWRFLAEVDLVSTVRADRRSTEERLPWLLTNRRAAEVTAVADGLWANLLDIPAALSARTYERPGELVLEVIGGDPKATRTRVRLEAGASGAAFCAVTRARPDLTIHADALGAAYLGGSPFRNAVLPRGVEEHRAGALDEADRLFRTANLPRCSTFF